MRTDSIYILDANTLITAKNLYYQFATFPGFWKVLVDLHQQGLVFTVESVRSEWIRNRNNRNAERDAEEDLAQWVRGEVPRGFFLPVNASDVVRAYREIMTWVHSRSNYREYAKARFANGADGWLIAYALVNSCTVVTLEERAPNAKRVIKIPDVCDRFDVDCVSTFDMLRELNVSF